MYTGGWIKIITDEETINITDKISGFMFLEAKAAYPTTNNDSITVKGVDGELPSEATFAPFNLVVKCGFDGYDVIDTNLAEHELRKLFYLRRPYYIVTSENPGIKYAVKNPDINPDYGDYRAVKFEMTFTVFKGYSESLQETDQYHMPNTIWQFENGLRAVDDIDYTHTKQEFKVFNGSSDEINPIKRHKINIEINIDAPNGFKLINNTTGDVFEYKGSLKYKQNLSLQGVHPILDKKRVGVNTNLNFIRLKPGYNKFEISGENIGKVQTKWIFPFIYR